MRYELYQIKAFNIPEVPAVYFIFSDEVLIYIGKSTLVNRRIKSSRFLNDFAKYGPTHFYIFPYYNDDLLKLEQKLITMFNPLLNKHHTSRTKGKNKKFSSRHTDKIYEKIELELKNFYSVTPSDENYLRFTHS